MQTLFTNLIGTLAVILVIAAVIGGTDMVSGITGREHNNKYSLILGLIGGIFGIYGNLSGISVNGAVISVRDTGPMLAGFTGGPLGGFVAGLIAGGHRLTMGGPTAVACIIATICIGTFCGLLAQRYREHLRKGWIAFLVGSLMECFHLGVVLLLVKPYSLAISIVRQIAFPFVLVNATGFTLMISIVTYIENQRRLTLEQGRMQSELETARVIQHSLLPPITEDFPGRSEFEIRAFMEPAKAVGGDFYDFFFMGSDKLAFLVADVSGKGIPAALFMATAKLTLQNCLRDIPVLSEAVRRANNSLCASNEAEMFVTAWIGVLDIPTGNVSFVCAGHNPPVIMTSAGPQFLKERTGFVLAGMEDVPYREGSLHLEPGDEILLYTDGVTEAENAGHMLFGEDRLLKSLRELHESGAEGVVEKVRHDLSAFVQGHDQFDDITMLCLRMN